MGDIETYTLVVTALIGVAAVVQHFYDRFAPKGLYLRSARVAAELPPRIGLEVENALQRVAASQEAKYGEQLKAAESQAAGALKGAEMSMVRAVGVDKQFRARVDSALSEAILGPALPVLRQFAPGLAQFLEENPQAVDVILEHPLFLKHVAPRLRQFLGKSGGDGNVVSPGWGT